MTGFSVSRKWIWPIVGGVVLVVAIAGYALVASRGGISVPTGTGPKGSDVATATAGGQVTTPGGTTAAGPGGSAAAGPGGTTATATKGTFQVKLLWWNDTKLRGAKNVVISWDGGSWSPDPALKSASRAIGPFPAGKSLKLTVYPDGKGGAAYAVPFTIRASMLSDSERDGIHIELRDDSLRVLGNSVQNFERNYARK